MTTPPRPAAAPAPWADRPAVAPDPGAPTTPGADLPRPDAAAPDLTGTSDAAVPSDPGTIDPDPERPRPGTVAAVLTAVLTGVVVGCVATAMHGSIWYLPGGVWLPWGLLFSGALLWFASVWSGTSTRRVWAAAVPGLVTYVLAWAFAYLKNGSALVVTTWDAPVGIVGYAWFAVIFVVVMTAVIVTGRRRSAQRRAAARAVRD